MLEHLHFVFSFFLITDTIIFAKFNKLPSLKWDPRLYYFLPPPLKPDPEGLVFLTPFSVYEQISCLMFRYTV